jgi:hypothetical protein
MSIDINAQASGGGTAAEIATFVYDQVGFMDKDELVAAVTARIDRLVAAAVEKARRDAYDLEVVAPQLNAACDDVALKIASTESGPDLPTFADEIALASAPHLQDAVREAVRADPAAFVQSLVKENEELKSEVRQHSMILDMHSELIGVVKDLVSELERSPAAPAHLAAVKALVERAESSRLGEAQIPMGVSPFRIMATMEKLVSSHSEVIMQFGRNMPGTTVASCVRVLADATRLLEEIHGPANEVDASRDAECDDDLVRPQAT